MTDPDRDDRIDLSALGISHDDGQMKRVVGGAMDRIRAMEPRASSPEDTSILTEVARWWYPGLAAAALVAVVAGATVLSGNMRRGRYDDAQVAARLAEWARTGHVPDNGELFATFHGLDR